MNWKSVPSASLTITELFCGAHWGSNFFWLPVQITSRSDHATRHTGPAAFVCRNGSRISTSGQVPWNCRPATTPLVIFSAETTSSVSSSSACNETGFASARNTPAQHRAAKRRARSAGCTCSTASRRPGYGLARAAALPDAQRHDHRFLHRAHAVGQPRVESAQRFRAPRLIAEDDRLPPSPSRPQ